MRVANDILIPELARLLQDGKEVRFTPSGVSMRPFIEGDQDSVILAPLTTQPRIGDILLVRVSDIKHQTSNIKRSITNPQSPGTSSRQTGGVASAEKGQSPITNHQLPITYVLHRLIRITNPSSLPSGEGRGEAFILQGDGNLQGEEQCRLEDIIGRVKRIEYPSGRRKPLTRGRIWYHLFPIRRYLLKIYRHSWLRWLYK